MRSDSIRNHLPFCTVHPSPFTRSQNLFSPLNAEQTAQSLGGIQETRTSGWYRQTGTTPMRSDKQKEASRANGSKSRGPVTPEGKANAANNAGTDNLSGDHFTLLSNEDPEQFLIHENEYLVRFNQIDGV